jgi:WXG100 family type VII secretion target
LSDDDSSAGRRRRFREGEERVVTGFDVSPAELASTRRFVDAVARDVIAEVSAVRRDVDDLLGAGWTGRSARTFAGGWQDWQDAARDTLRALDTMAELLGLAGRDFADSDAVVAGHFAKFAS